MLWGQAARKGTTWRPVRSIPSMGGGCHRDLWVSHDAGKPVSMQAINHRNIRPLAPGFPPMSKGAAEGARYQVIT